MRFLLPLLILSSLASSCMTVPPLIDSNFKQVHEGMSRAEVIALLGEPSSRNLPVTGQQAGVESLIYRGKTLSTDSLNGYMNYQRTVMVKGGEVVGFTSSQSR